jgi:hypothetical protein
MSELENHTYKMLLSELEEMEILIDVYQRTWGPNSDEVKLLDSKVYALNLKILDILNENRGL